MDKTNHMQQEEILKDKYGTETGFRVPEGYFDRLNERIMSELPPYVEMPTNANLTMWQRVKPYVYLAAMFAGIWVMMKVFHTVSSSDRLTLENPPEAIVQALEGDSMDEIIMLPYDSDYEIESEVSASYESIEDFEADFGYEILPEYDTVTLPGKSEDTRG